MELSQVNDAVGSLGDPFLPDDLGRRPMGLQQAGNERGHPLTIVDHRDGGSSEQRRGE
jgi:hypothetical protein